MSFVEPEEDLQDLYYEKWSFYLLERRAIDAEEEARLEAKIRYILTGDVSTRERKCNAAAKRVEKRNENNDLIKKGRGGSRKRPSFTKKRDRTAYIAKRKA